MLKIPRKSTTSKALAASSTRIRRQQDLIEDFLELCGDRGATYHEVSEGTGIPASSAVAALSKLANAGIVHVEGVRAGRGAECQVWRIGPPCDGIDRRARRRTARILREQLAERDAEISRLKAELAKRFCGLCGHEIERKTPRYSNRNGMKSMIRLPLAR